MTKEYAKVAQWREKPGCSIYMEAWETMFQYTLSV